MILALANNMRRRPGYLTSVGFFTGCIAFTFWKGPQIENPVVRYALAGTAATLFQEIFMHGLDTLNMRSKVINGPKLYVFELIRKEGFVSLMRGIQPVLYGYIFSSFLYFNFYALSKMWLRSNYFSNPEEDDSMTNFEKARRLVLITLVVSFASSMVAEIFSLTLYYPFDLIKTRMQANHSYYGYTGTLDAIIKIYQENPNLVINQANAEKNAETLWQKIMRIRNLYRGMFLYSLSYTTHIAL